VEVFPPNDFYGFATVVKRFAGYSGDKPICGVVPHGVIFGLTRPWFEEVRAEVPAILCAQDDYGREFAHQAGRVVIPFASPAVYAAKLTAGDSGLPRQGTIFFPSHSTHRIQAEYDAQLMIAKLKALPTEMQPVTVCIYWKDYLHGKAGPYEAAGLPVVSAGHMFDPAFLIRFFRMCRCYRYATSNELGSHVPFSIHAGCLFRLITGVRPRHLGSPEALEADVALADSVEHERLWSLFSFERDNNLDEQVVVADDLLGVKYAMTPEEVRALLEHLAQVDRRGWGDDPRGAGQSRIPCRYRRVARRLAYAIPNLFSAGIRLVQGGVPGV
jgi:hypothetical protein